MESFESFAPNNPFSSATFSFVPTNVTAQATTSANISVWEILNPTETYDGTYPTGGTRFLLVVVPTTDLDLSRPVLGVGLYITDVEFHRPVVTLTYDDNTTQSFIINASINTVSGNILFWGYKSTPSKRIKRFSFSWQGGRTDGVGVDQITVIDAACFEHNGDVNEDGIVDDADLLAVLFAFGNAGDNLGREDINCDRVVDDADLLIVLFNFGQGS